MSEAVDERSGGAGAVDAEAHAPLVEKGLDDSHLDAVAAHLQSTLEELNAPGNLMDEVMRVAASTRDDVLNR